jgi:hypothetical protein
VRAAEHRGDLAIRLLREPIQLQVLTAIEVRPALRDLVGRDPRRREELHQLGTGEPLERPGVGDLMHAAANEQIAGQRAGGRVSDHLVDLELVVPGPGLEEEVVREILDEVARGEHVVAVPGLAHRVLAERGGAPGDELLGVPSADDAREARLALGCAREHGVDRGSDQLDVAELLGRDARHQVVERPSSLPIAEVERLVGVVHERRHLAELAAQKLLHRGGPDRVGVGWRR